MRISELKALAKERGLKGYSRLSEAELIELLEPTRSHIPPPNPQPSSDEMDIFEKQEMEKKRPIVKKKLNEWFNWIVNFTPESIKEKATGAFKTFKNKILDLYKEVWKNPLKEQEEKEPDFIPIEQAFDKALEDIKSMRI